MARKGFGMGWKDDGRLGIDGRLRYHVVNGEEKKKIFYSCRIIVYIEKL